MMNLIMSPPKIIVVVVARAQIRFIIYPRNEIVVVLYKRIKISQTLQMISPSNNIKLL
jgi:hypothetical protein